MMLSICNGYPGPLLSQYECYDCTHARGSISMPYSVVTWRHKR